MYLPSAGVTKIEGAATCAVAPVAGGLHPGAFLFDGAWASRIRLIGARRAQPLILVMPFEPPGRSPPRSGHIAWDICGPG